MLNNLKQGLTCCLISEVLLKPSHTHSLFSFIQFIVLPMAAFNYNCRVEYIAHKAKYIYYPDLYRKSLPTPPETMTVTDIIMLTTYNSNHKYFLSYIMCQRTQIEKR